MAGRIRSLKPELLDDESNAALSDAAWRLWVSMRLLADDHGNLRAGDRYLGAMVWQDTARDVATPRNELERAGKIVVYDVGGEKFAHLCGWESEQRIDNAGKPRVPRPDEGAATGIQELAPDLAETRRSSPRPAESFEEIPLARARAHSGGEDHRSPITDLRSPTNDHRPSSPTSAVDAAVQPVFEAWSEARRKRHPRGGAPKLDEKRAKVIRARLADGFDIETLCRAARGIWASPFHLGANEREREYTDIALALRDAEHVERFAQLVDAGSERRAVVEDFGARPLHSSAPALTPDEREESARILADGMAAFGDAIAAKGAT